MRTGGPPTLVLFTIHMLAEKKLATIAIYRNIMLNRIKAYTNEIRFLHVGIGLGLFLRPTGLHRLG